jgi:nitrogen fixation protein NifU and related proteins
MADTINTGTEPTEENTLMPESLRFESEPWTSFYMAGEIIRESRKASGKQTQYACEGNTAQSDQVIDHSNHPRNAGSLPKDNPNVGTGLVGAPLSGHVMELRIRMNPEVQVIEEEAEFKKFGCGSAIVSSSLTTELVKGKTSRKRWPSRTRISAANLALPQRNPFRWPKTLAWTKQ